MFKAVTAITVVSTLSSSNHKKHLPPDLDNLDWELDEYLKLIDASVSPAAAQLP